MADAARKLMSVEEFFLWCRDQEQRYELLDGIPIPLRSMAGAALSHDRIVSNLIGLLYGALKGSGCWATTPDAGLRTAIRRVRRPDVTIECAPPAAEAYEVKNPTAVFEVLSPTTRKNDRNVKLPEYLRHPGLRLIVLIDPDIMDVLIYRREGEGPWEDERLLEPEQSLRVSTPPASLKLADIYDGVPLAASPPHGDQLG